MKDKIDLQNIPRHVAVIMDGNGRWAKGRGAARLFGHKNAIKAVRDITEGAAELGVGFLTLYAFSTENWNRPKLEVRGLMELLVATIKGEVGTLNKNNVRLKTIGNIKDLPGNCEWQLAEAMEITKDNTGLTLVLALNYGGRSELVEATKKIAEDINSGRINTVEIDEEKFSTYLDTKNIPDPELLIRTSGEMRISNFLLWQVAYSELFFTDVLWPDFRKENLFEAIVSYQKRERRFGKISEQLNV